MSTDHQAIIQLIIAYTLVGAFIFTVAITCLSLVGWVRFADPKQQNRLFLVLIIELVTIGLGSFSNFLRLNPGPVINQIGTTAIVDLQERTSDTRKRTSTMPYQLDTLLAQIDALSEPQAVKLAANPPTSSSEVEQLISAVDPGNLRTSDPAAAKKTLKMRIVYMRRQPEEFGVWEMALAEDSGANNPIKPTR